MSLTPLSLDNIQCNRPMADRMDRPMPSKYVPQNLPQRKQSVFVAPSGLSAILSPPPPPPPPPLHRPMSSPPKKSSLPKANAQILEQHISKIISENAAIVETLDPLWSKRYISRNSTSALPTFSANGLIMAANHMQASNESQSASARRFSEVHSHQPLSKLQSALLGKSSAHCAAQSSANTRKYSDFSSSSESSHQSVIINAKDSNVNNNSNNNNINKYNNNINNNSFNNISNNNSNSSGSEGEYYGSDSIVRNLLTTKTPAIQVTPPPDKTSPHNQSTLGAHPQNPEGSIIKDLLLKSRDEVQRKKSRTEAQISPAGASTASAEQESSMLVYVCTVCNIAFRNKENLEVHQIHYCKGNDDLSVSRPSKHKMEDLVQRKVSVMARPNYASGKHYHPKHSLGQPIHQQKMSTSMAPTPPVGNILKQQLLAPNQGPPLKKRKTSEPVFRTNSSNNSADIQIIEEHSVRRTSVVQPNHQTSHLSTMITKSNNPLDTSRVAPIASLSSISSVHTVIQPVLHSGATVIENYLSESKSKSIPICFDASVSSRHCQASTPQMTTTTTQPQPVRKCGSDLVSNGAPIEILPAYLPHLQRPYTKITFKGPIVFPVLKNLCANGSNHEFAVDECGSFKPTDASNACKTNCTTTTTTTCAPFRQVASLPQNTNSDKNSNELFEEIEEEIEIRDKDKENDKQLTSSVVSSPPNGLTLPKATGAVRPRTLSLRTNNGSNLISSTLISPDTPRPNKTCVQLFMSGHAYSRIGLKVNPRPVYCTIYKTQPMFVTQDEYPGLSMYSNWKASPLAADDVMNLLDPPNPPVVLGLYDSRTKVRLDSMVRTSAGKSDLNSTHSSYWQFRKSSHPDGEENLKDMIARLREDIGENAEQVYRKISEVSASSAYSGDTDSDCGGEVGPSGTPPKRVRIFEGGFKSNEDYTYVRGRGRGKYVCEECGIRCKKPSMLKKHIRTHTDLRPYSCRHCAFAFKTKGNLTKHMKSKAHHKKCVELGIIPVPITIDESQIDTDALAKQEMLEISCGNLPEDEDEDEDEGEYDEDEEEEEDEGVPIPLIELQRYESMSKSVPIVPGQFDDADMPDGHVRPGSESGSAATEAEEQEAARSLLILSGSGSESDLTSALAAGSRKTSNAVNEDIANSPEKRKLSVIDRRISQQVIEEQQRRVSQVLEAEHHRRISQHVLEAEQQRRISLQMDSALKANELQDFHSSTAIMKPPSEPLMPSPRKLSPIEQLQQQVNQQQHQMLQNAWTPNSADQVSRQRSYSFNDVPLVPPNTSAFVSTAHMPIEPMEAISDESSDGDSMDSFTARRYSMSVIGDRHFHSQPKAPNSHMSSIPEREEPMDLSLSSKPNEVIDGIVMPPISHLNSVPKALSTGLRAGEFIPTAPQRVVIDSIDGKSICSICSKQFSKPSQLRLHINIHYFERPFRCDSCAVSFRTKGHLQKHKRSVSHFNKVNMNMTFGTPTTDNPRPFKCADCKIAFRIHGHLAKHLRSKMHIMKLECLGKLPFGMYAEMERSGVNLNEIDTTDCENSLQSLQLMAQRLYDPRHPGQMRWASDPIDPIPENEDSFEDSSLVKNEPNDHFYGSSDRERHSPQVVTSQAQPSSPSPPPVANSIHSEVSPIGTPSPPIRAKTPPIPPVQQPVVAVQQQSGFTSTRSNTCHLCGRLFKGAKFLQVHLYCDHQQESPSPQTEERNDFECDICHKGFNDVLVLQQHLLSHSAPRPYVCDVCDAGFTSTLLLASHLQIHHPLAQQQIA